jgi:heat shock protein HslJ
MSFLAACSSRVPTAAPTQVPTDPGLTPAKETGPANTDVLSLEALMNAVYSGIYPEPVKLSNGIYVGLPFAAGDPARPTLEYVDGEEIFGDLDGDGVEDAAVFLLERGGGTAAFTYVAAQLNRNGQPVDAGAALVEDRTQVRSAFVQNGQIVLDITTRGPGDPDCCPTHKIRKIYALQADRLVEEPVERQSLAKISIGDLYGTSWRLLEMDTGIPALADAEITISFQEDQISGSGGCNDYNSRFSLHSVNPFIITINPVAVTQQACPDPLLNQENAYYAALENASLWGYNYGKLVLAYADGQDGDLKLLLFAPLEAP